MLFVVISYGNNKLDNTNATDDAVRSHRYREELIKQGKIVVHGHIAGQKGHLWVYDVDSVDELDRVVSNDPMYAYIQNDPQIYALISTERAHEREEKMVAAKGAMNVHAAQQ
jgi:muconolactone delta-isomerase